MKLIKRLVRAGLRSWGYDIVGYASGTRILPALPDLPGDEAQIVSQVRPFTITSPERLAALISSVKYLSKYRIGGAIVECGVLRGGSMMAAALSLLAQGDTTRDLVLYDTFEGMTAPSERDFDINGRSAQSQAALLGRKSQFAASLEEVKENLFSTGYPRDRIHFVKGRVEDTIPAMAPAQIAILRLDTDWYESTKHELAHLYPLLDCYGILIIDDYGHWMGARRAVDEYLGTLSERFFLHRIDYTGRMIVRGGW